MIPEPSQPGQFVISLDFELHWGVRETRSIANYGENILGVRRAIPALLDMFSRYTIHATWATVGFLFFDRKSDLLAACPDRRPHYDRAKLSPYPDMDVIGENETEDPYHYGLSLLRLIQSCPHQEIGSHSFSHYYCLESGPEIEDFRADLVAAKTVAASRGIKLESFVFPRNQFSVPHLEICREEGFLCYRGNPGPWFYEGEGGHADNTPLRRILRLTDAYMGISAPQGRAKRGDSLPVDVPASRFLRPYVRRLRSLETLRLRRITHEMTYSARGGLTYHLWWHPHNFGVNLAENLAFLGKVLDHFRLMREKYGMQSHNMREAAGSLLAR